MIVITVILVICAIPKPDTEIPCREGENCGGGTFLETCKGDSDCAVNQFCNPDVEVDGISYPICTVRPCHEDGDCLADNQHCHFNDPRMDPVNEVAGTCIVSCESQEDCNNVSGKNENFLRGCSSSFPFDGECVMANCLSDEHCLTEALPHCGAPYVFSCVECLADS
jgi:hypothetical protein